MEVYERPGWAHPSPLVNPSEQVTENVQEVTEETPVEEVLEEAPVEPTE